MHALSKTRQVSAQEADTRAEQGYGSGQTVKTMGRFQTRRLLMARFILETDNPSERTCILMRQAFSSSSNNPSVYSTDKQTNHPSRRAICLIRLPR